MHGVNEFPRCSDLLRLAPIGSAETIGVYNRSSMSRPCMSVVSQFVAQAFAACGRREDRRHDHATFAMVSRASTTQFGVVRYKYDGTLADSGFELAVFCCTAELCSPLRHP